MTAEEAVNDGRADYTPVYLGEIEELFENGAMPLDVALIQVSPPGAHGFCSLGIGVETALDVLKSRVKKTGLLEINRKALEAGRRFVDDEIRPAPRPGPTGLRTRICGMSFLTQK